MDDLSWGTSRDDAGRIVDRFLELGGNFVDTSSTYGTSEAFLGEILGSRRHRVVIGARYGASTLTTDPNRAGSHRKGLVRSVEETLRNLRSEYVDLLWLNSWDGMTPIEELTRAVDDLVRQGKVLYFGVANAPAWLVAHATTHAELKSLTPVTAMQLRYNLLARDADREHLPMARMLDIGVVAWSPLASGFLSGKYLADATGASTPPTGSDSRRLDDPSAAFFVRRNERNEAIVRETSRVAAEIGATPAQTALAWLRQQGIIPCVGARTVAQITENLRAPAVALTDEQRGRLDAVSRISLGYPHDFLAATMVKQHTYGGTFDQIDSHRRHWLPA